MRYANEQNKIQDNNPETQKRKPMLNTAYIKGIMFKKWLIQTANKKQKHIQYFSRNRFRNKNKPLISMVERNENVSPIHLCFKSQSLKVAQRKNLCFKTGLKWK